MKKYSKLFFILFSLHPKVFSQTKIISGNIVFSVKHIITDSSKVQIANLKTRMLEQLKKDAAESEDTMMGQAMVAMFSDMFEKLTLDTTQYSIKINFSPDTICQYQINSDTIVSDYLHIDPITGKSFYRAKINQNLTYPNHDFIGFYKSGVITIDKKDRKQIQGFDCYKLVYELQSQIDEEENFKINDGNTIYEMYVTEQIALPVHALFITHELLNKFFPLEITKYSVNFNGLIEKYTISNIKN